MDLNNHPIFSLPKSFKGPIAHSKDALELSTTTLSKFKDVEEDGPTPSGRRRVMVLKDGDLIVAAGQEVRMSCLSENSSKKQYKTLHTPNVQFDIHQIALSPTGKLLAVAGAFQVAVIVLPRTGYSRLVPETIDCKSVQVGQFYHGSRAASPIAKVEWHPWGEAGSTLVVVTADGKLREYDISTDTEEPSQIISFVPPRKRGGSYHLEDPSEREVVSFTFGSGRGDWGPLTVYAVMSSGDVYAICPYMPMNASIPSSYVHSLECFVAAKLEFLATQPPSPTPLSTVYDYQQKYIAALVKQLPSGTVFPAVSRSVLMHPPTTIRSPALRQGPFLLQPAPRTLEGSEGGDATDIAYMSFGRAKEEEGENGGDVDHLGAVLLAYQDGKVDVCLDVDKVEARWDVKQNSNPGLPMLAVYETIDLGLVSLLSPLNSLDLLQGNHPVFVVDPIHEDTAYVYHAFGVHALHLEPVLHSLSRALRAGEESDDVVIREEVHTDVQPVLTTFSIERKCSNPVIAVTVPDDVYLNYSIYILTSSMRVTSLPLTVRSDSWASEEEEDKPLLPPPGQLLPAPTDPHLVKSENTPAPYISYLSSNPYTPPKHTSGHGLPRNPVLSLPQGGEKDKEKWLTPDTLRYLHRTTQTLTGQGRDLQIGYRNMQIRTALQVQEIGRLSEMCRGMYGLVERLKERGRNQSRVERVREEQRRLMGRMDAMLKALMRKASPELSEVERAWFEELEKMRREAGVHGKERGEENLRGRVRLLEEEHQRLMPYLTKEKEKSEKALNKSTSALLAPTLGASQLKEYEARSAFEMERLAKMQQDIIQLAERLSISVGRPPSPTQVEPKAKLGRKS